MIDVIIRPDGKFRLISMLLEHNHSLSSWKARCYTSSDKMVPHVKRRLEMTDPAEIAVNKTFIEDKLDSPTNA